MYENMTYEGILQRMIDRVTEQDENLDTRPSSPIYNALAPAAAELQLVYIQLDTVLNETFASTASRDNLILRAQERGLIPYPATQAVLRGEFNRDIPLGARFSLDEFNYTAVERVSAGVYVMECEQTGSAPNVRLEGMIPIDYIDGLTSARLAALLIPGEDEEDTEHLRQRYLKSLDGKAFGGNIADYKEKVQALNGVGGAKVYPVWNGGGTVKLVIIGSNYSAPSAALIESVQDQVDPPQGQGNGLGLAPIGHVVTVEGVSATPVNITTNITYAFGTTWANIAVGAQQAVDAYFVELAQQWADAALPLLVRISQIESRLLNLPGVMDVTGTRLNGAEQNLTLGENAIPARGTLSG